MIENLDVVNLFTIGHFAFLGMSSVIETGAIFHPSNAGKARAFDGLGQNFAGRSFDEVKRALFRSAGGSAIGHIFSVFSRKPPVERDGSVGGQFVNVNQNLIVTFQFLAHIENGLVLVALAPGMEIIFAAHLRSADGAYLKQLRQARISFLASGEGVKDRAGITEFLLDVTLGIWVVRIFQIAIRIDDLMALNSLLNRGDFGLGRTGRYRRSIGIRSA